MRKVPKDRIKPKDFAAYFEAIRDEVMEGKEFVNSDEVRTVLNYFYGVNDFDAYGVVKNKADINKGLYIYGTYGNGKTTLMDIIHQMGKRLILNHGNASLWFPMKSAKWFPEQYMLKASDKRGIVNFIQENWHKGKLAIDDLGAEKLAFKEVDVLEDIMFHRHREGVQTFVTSNMTPKEYGEKYGGRLADRFEETFNIIKFKSEGFREGTSIPKKDAK